MSIQRNIRWTLSGWFWQKAVVGSRGSPTGSSKKARGEKEGSSAIALIGGLASLVMLNLSRGTLYYSANIHTVTRNGGG